MFHLIKPPVAEAAEPGEYFQSINTNKLPYFSENNEYVDIFHKMQREKCESTKSVYIMQNNDRQRNILILIIIATQVVIIN